MRQIDLDNSKLVVTYTNASVHGEIYDTNGTMMLITGVNDDGDSLCETGEKYKVTIDFSELLFGSMFDPVPARRARVYSTIMVFD